MAMWRSRKQSLLGAKGTVPAWYLCGSGGDTEKVSKGYVPMVLVDDREDDDDLQGQKIMVHVSMLREPCMAALLDVAEKQFGLNLQCHPFRAHDVHVERFKLIRCTVYA
jgi:hypothetical protein